MFYDQSVFGPTMGGVPNPRIPHVHPYPTRYHGPIWTTPVFGLPYRSQPYLNARPGYEAQWLQLQGMGTSSPDGLGEPLLCSSTGSTLLDAAFGAAVGYIAAPQRSSPQLWAAAGAGAAVLAGLLGVLGVAGAGLLARSGKKLAVANPRRKRGAHFGQPPGYERPERTGKGAAWRPSSEYVPRGYDDIHVGDRVTLVTAQGQERTGRVVMHGPGGWVLNMGGPHGTPGIVNEGNFVRIARRAKRNSRTHGLRRLR